MPAGANDGLRRVDHEGTKALIDAAVRQGVKRFVYVSFSGNIRQESPLESAKRACENQLLASELTAVILRPSYFMEVWLSPALGFDATSGSVRIYGSGEAKVSYVSGATWQISPRPRHCETTRKKTPFWKSAALNLSRSWLLCVCLRTHGGKL